MKEELLEQEQSIQESVDTNSDYIAAIKELKQNTVSKEDYLKLKNENKNLLQSLVNGEVMEQDKPQVDLPKRSDLLKLYKENNFNSDLDYWKNIIALRDATIREYGRDPMVTGNYGVDSNGDKVQAAYGEAEAVEEQMSIISDIIEQSNNDPQVFQVLMAQASK